MISNLFHNQETNKGSEIGIKNRIPTLMGENG